MSATLRMQPEDSTYWLVREAFGWSVVLQVLWRFPTRPDRAELDALNERLCAGVLNRRLVRASVPLARHRWEHADFAPALTVDTDQITPDGIEAWAGEELDSAPLDPEHGPAWRLRAVAVTDGGFVLSLTALHLVADGRTVVEAAVAALTGTAADPLASGSAVSRSTGTAAEVLDGLGQIAAAGRGIATAALTLARQRVPLSRRGGDGGSPSTVAEVRPAKRPAHERSPRARCSWVTISVDSAQWDSVARRHGGTANTLFIAILAGALRARGYADGAPLKLGIPVSRRTDGDDRGNATAGVAVQLTERLAPGADLGPLRRRCKDAFARLSAGHRAAHVHLLPLVQLLPTGVVVRAATAGSGMPDAVASNLGDFPERLRSVGATTADAVAFRGIAQGVDPAGPHRFGDGLQSWAIRCADVLTFSVAAFDEHCFPDAEQLRTVLAGELDGWQLSYRMW